MWVAVIRSKFSCRYFLLKMSDKGYSTGQCDRFANYLIGIPDFIYLCTISLSLSRSHTYTYVYIGLMDRVFVNSTGNRVQSLVE